MTTAFLLTPDQSALSNLSDDDLDPFAPIPDNSTDTGLPRWRGGSAANEKLDAVCAEIDAEIRARLTPDVEIEFLAGIGAWAVRSFADATAKKLRERLSGVPVDIAENTEFQAH